jgi:hypothetical protein
VVGLEEIEALPIPGGLNWRPPRGVLDGEVVDAAAGTLVFVQPDVYRHGVAVAPDTEVVAFGGFPVFRPSGSEFIWRVRAALPDVRAAQEIVDDGPEDSPGVMYAQALIDRAAGRESDALARALEIEPRLAGEARVDRLT